MKLLTSVFARWHLNWSLRVRTFAVISLVLAMAIGATAVVLSLNARKTLQVSVERDMGMLARVLARTIRTSHQLPDMAEDLMGEGMLASAMGLAHYVGVAERAGETPTQINATLKRLTDSALLDEIWITDSKGHAYLHSSTGSDFTFNPNPEIQPQASAFWPLLDGKTAMVNQSMQPRDQDQKPYKYVAVAGVDKPRIVQIGMDGAPIAQMRDFVGVKRLVDELVDSGTIRAMWVVDVNLSLVAHQQWDGAMLTAIDETRKERLTRVISTGETLTQFFDDRMEVTRPIRDEQKRALGAFTVQWSRESLDRLLREQMFEALVVGALVFVFAGMLSLLFADRITQPLAVIMKAAGRVQVGNFTRLQDLHETSQRKDEIGQLSRVFEHMAHDVGNRERELDRLVKERTHELADKNEALEVAQQRIDEELDLGRKLQLAILPARFPDSAQFKAQARMLPATSMGGDFYDFIDLGEGRVAIVMADVSGKGVAAAFFMAVARTSINSLVRLHADPAVCLMHANNELCAQNPLDMFVTVFLGIFDTRSGALVYANAGHPTPYRMSQQGTLQALPYTSGMALGVMPELDYVHEVVQLEDGEGVLAYTDGVTEAFDRQQQVFGEKRLQDLLREQVAGTPQDWVAAIFERLKTFADGAPQSDDITVAALRWYAAADGIQTAANT